jgi:hypothetical protein
MANPGFQVRDLSVSFRHYQRLGFATRAYDKGGYGFVTLDDVEIHLGVVVPGGTAIAPASAYLFVEDAGQLAQTWALAGADVRVPEDTRVGTARGRSDRPGREHHSLRLPHADPSPIRTLT